jgi:hypothetical protein
MLDLAILGGGPAGMGPLVWAARNGILQDWLDGGVAVVERTAEMGGSLGQYLVNADSLGRSFLECLDPPPARALLASACDAPATRLLQEYRHAYPPLRLVADFEHGLGRTLGHVISAHPGGSFLPHTTVDALHINRDGSITVQLTPRGSLRARAVVIGLGGREERGAVFARDLLPGVRLADIDETKIVFSGDLLTEAGLARARAILVRADGAKTIIVGGSHSAFSAAWALLQVLPNPPFGAGDITLLCRREPKVFYPSRAAAGADGYAFAELDVCPLTQRVHRLGGLRNDGREIWRRLSGRPGAPPEPRAAVMLLSDPSLSPERLRRVLDEAALIVPALGYRLCTLPVYDAAGRRLRLMAEGGMPAVDRECRILLAEGGMLPNVFGIGLGSNYHPWGETAGESGFDGQQNSLWLYQNGLGRLIYEGARRQSTKSSLPRAKRAKRALSDLGSAAYAGDRPSRLHRIRTP